MTSARRVAFVRHGETDWNRQRRIQGHTDVPLNDVGREQAREVGRRLAAGSWDCVLSSPLARAVGTAELLAHVLDAPPPYRVGGLVERKYGRAEGLPVNEVNELWPDGEYPGSESLVHLGERGRAVVIEVLNEYEGDLILVSHGALLRATMSVLTGRSFPRVPNGTATVLEYFPGSRDWQNALVAGPAT